MLRGYVNHDLPNRALSSYVEMLRKSKNIPDRFTFPSLLKGCAQSLDVNVGKVLHAQVIKLELHTDLYVETTLINMYAACGNINSARAIFDKMGQRNQVVWTSMICGYAKNHYPKEALFLFNEMEREGHDPDEVTMVTLLSACAELRDLEFGKKLHSRILESDTGKDEDSYQEESKSLLGLPFCNKAYVKDFPTSKIWKSFPPFQGRFMLLQRLLVKFIENNKLHFYKFLCSMGGYEFEYSGIRMETN
ncbi:hypothetical protein L1049_018566 [Liquidambar formosana]|uniref:Pentatricopeptide repeat-containing protein n=1 Tax=Liquidambar formosana TaxID=63359 RepID=A0AAP0RA96_LIQFO